MVLQVSKALLKIKRTFLLNLEGELEAERIKGSNVEHLQEYPLQNAIQELKLSKQTLQEQQDDSTEDLFLHQQFDESTYVSPQHAPPRVHSVVERFRYPGGMDYSNGSCTSVSSGDEDSVCSHATSKSTISTRNLDRRSRRKRRQQMLKEAMEGSNQF